VLGITIMGCVSITVSAVGRCFVDVADLTCGSADLLYGSVELAVSSSAAECDSPISSCDPLLSYPLPHCEPPRICLGAASNSNSHHAR
jgi:hypothetical protein